MNDLHEDRLRRRAHGLGLELSSVAHHGGTPLYRLIETGNGDQIFPGGAADGVPLTDLEDWLSFPWE